MKCIKTTEAVGHILCHDITRIVPGKFKGAAFKKGHVVREEDIPILLDMGKENLYVWERTKGMLHEDEAAEALKELCIGESNPSFTAGVPSEGKIEITALADGLLKVNSDALKAVNLQGEMMIATIHGNYPVRKGESVAAMRIIPLVIESQKLQKAKDECMKYFRGGENAILSILAFKSKKIGIIVTGSEVSCGRIEDKFSPVMVSKLKEYDYEVSKISFCSDNQEEIVSELANMERLGFDLVMCTGGMSVDPDDKTPGAIKAFGADILSYGAPVLPGAMFLLGYKGEMTVLGVPGCAMYNRRTVLDLILPRVLCDDVVTKEELAEYAEGGLCLGCRECHFPNCGFGK